VTSQNVTQNFTKCQLASNHIAQRMLRSVFPVIDLLEEADLYNRNFALRMYVNLFLNEGQSEIII